MSRHFGNHFTTKSPEGSFLGSFGTFIHAPILGRPFFDPTVSLSKLSGLPVRLQEIVILTAGVYFQAAYELYAHGNVARNVGVEKDIIEWIRHGGKSGVFGDDGNGGSEEEEEMNNTSLVYDVSKALVETPGPLKRELYDRAVEALGVDGTMALVQFVGFYAYMCAILNGFDV